MFLVPPRPAFVLSVINVFKQGYCIRLCVCVVYVCCAHGLSVCLSLVFFLQHLCALIRYQVGDIDSKIRFWSWEPGDGYKLEIAIDYPLTTSSFQHTMHKIGGSGTLYKLAGLPVATMFFSERLEQLGKISQS